MVHTVQYVLPFGNVSVPSTAILSLPLSFFKVDFLSFLFHMHTVAHPYILINRKVVLAEKQRSGMTLPEFTVDSRELVLAFTRGSDHF